MKITFICTGNTCRSPLAEALASAYIDENKINGIEVDSAGLDCNYGAPISENSRILIEENKIFYMHTSQMLNERIMRESDRIITMTAQQRDIILSQCQPTDKYKVFCIDDYTHKGNIVDPYGQNLEVYRRVCEQLKHAVKIIVDQIVKLSK